MQQDPWHDYLVDSLEHATDLDSQRTAWDDRTLIELPINPGELMCQIFDDTGIGDLVDAGRPIFLNEQMLRCAH